MSKQKELFAAYLEEGGEKPLSSREMVVLSMIVAGNSWDTIAKTLEVTKARVRQIADKVERRIKRGSVNVEVLAKDIKARHEDPRNVPVHGLISTRLEHALINRHVSTLGDVINLGRVGLLRTQNIGGKYIAELDWILKLFDLDLPD